MKDLGFFDFLTIALLWATAGIVSISLSVYADPGDTFLISIGAFIGAYYLSKEILTKR